MKKDIETRGDIEHLMEQFYQKLIPDTIVGYIFTDVAKLNLSEHLPVLADFWEIILLGTGNYKGNVMLKHLELNNKTALLPEHFERWKKLFFETLKELYSGPVADEAIRRVNLMEGLMQFKIEQQRDKNKLV
jgi:hemoglobin